MSLDPTALLAELAAIRGDVKTACMVAILDAPGPIADGLLSIGDRLDALMYAIAAPPPYRDLRRAQDDAHEAHDAG